VEKSLDTKLTDIRNNSDSNAFIIAYAADPDMSWGVATLPGGTSIQTFCDGLADLVEQAKIDILLTSVSSMDILARERNIFEASPVTPAVRANDTSDLWATRGGSYQQFPSRPFATTTIEEAQFGSLLPELDHQPDVNLGLYSVTFNNDLDADWYTLEQFKNFRIESAQNGFRYFLEVFNPNVSDSGIPQEQVGNFVIDHIARMLAGVPRASRPEFLKIAYNGPASMEALVTYDSSVIVGILGGVTSTTYDAYKLIAEARKYGARVALFGRRIRGAENPRAFLDTLRDVADGEVSPEEGVKVYRDALGSLGVAPIRSLDDDMVLFTPGLKQRSLGQSEIGD
jgi:orotidine-5'-phosphate decarboxylase